MQGHDVVFGAFERKQAAGYRRLGSRLIGLVNRRVFGQPDDLVVSNFRILRRDVVDRICSSRTAHPYLTGQALLYSGNRANVVGAARAARGRRQHLLVPADPRPRPHDPLQLLLLPAARPGVDRLRRRRPQLRARRRLPGARRCSTDTRVEGWTTLVVLLAVFNGFTIGLLSMLGEYVVRTLNAVSAQDTYHVRRRVSRVTDYFLVVGAQRCGTTYLRTLLDEHPSIVMATPSQPEPKVFLDDDVVRRGLEWYDATWFAGAPAGALRGEKSTSYLEVPALRSTGCAPCSGTRWILVQLRDPVARAVSNWRFEHRARAGVPGPGHGTDRQPARTRARGTRR